MSRERAGRAAARRLPLARPVVPAPSRRGRRLRARPHRPLGPALRAGRRHRAGLVRRRPADPHRRRGRGDRAPRPGRHGRRCRATAYIPIPAALRRRCGLVPGDQVLLAALPDQDTLTAYCLAVVDQAIRAHGSFPHASTRRTAMTTTPASPAASQQAAVDAALLVLKSMGLSLDDLTAAPSNRQPVPTFAEYVPVVAATVTQGTLRAYRPYWRKVVEQWGGRPSTSRRRRRSSSSWPTSGRTRCPRRNSRGGRSAGENLISALRCLYQRAARRRAGRRERQPRPQGRQAAPPAVHPPGTGRRPARGDQPGRRHHGRRPRTRHAHLAAAHRDRLPARRRARAPRPRTWTPSSAWSCLREKGETVPLAAGLPDPDGGAGEARRGTARPGGRAAAALPERAPDHRPALRLPVGPHRPGTALGPHPGDQHALAPAHHADVGGAQLRVRGRPRLRRPHRRQGATRSASRRRTCAPRSPRSPLRWPR